MNTLNILPFEGLGDLRFGMLRTDVHSLLGEDFDRVSEGQPADMEVYDSIGLHLDYDKDDKLVFIEAVPPCNPIYTDIQLLRGTYQAVLTKLAKLGHTAVCDDQAYNFGELGFSLYVPSQLEGVSIYRQGYYDE